MTIFFLISILLRQRPSTKYKEIKFCKRLQLHAQIKDKFPDPDNDLAAAAKKAGNIIFAQSFKPKTEAQSADSVKKRSETMTRRLKLMKKKFISYIDREKYSSSIFSAYDIEAPVDILIKESSVYIFFNLIPTQMVYKENILF